ncbi:MAG: hypothetical protein CMM73_04540 [Rhodospirillaceae bacterium]|nr:hypothetical protein [Rhodospirillaceae bacterium]|tara:strand:+ start:180 stop:377 length:198 start_codon:yes stop_codon:yes gene_type:complete
MASDIYLLTPSKRTSTYAAATSNLAIDARRNGVRWQNCGIFSIVTSLMAIALHPDDEAAPAGGRK